MTFPYDSARQQLQAWQQDLDARGTRLEKVALEASKVQTRGAIKKTGDAMLALPDLPPLPGTIRWVNGKDCGIEFREQIPAEALSRWLQERGFSDID